MSTLPARAVQRLRTPPLRAAVAALGLPRCARVVELACGGNGMRTVPQLAALFDGPIVVLGHRPDRATLIVERLGERVEILNRDPIDFDGGPFDLVVINSGLAGTLPALTRMLAPARRLVAPDGHVALHAVIRTRVDGKPAPGLSPGCLARLDPFFAVNFETFEPSLEQMLAPLAAAGFEVDTVVPAAGGAGGAELGVAAWILLRPGTQSSADRPYRSADKGFALGATVSWLSSLRDDGARFVFPEELEQVQARRRAGPDADGRLIVLKHDIHHDMRRTLAMAEAEAAAGLHGLYFMMGPHELNAKFLDDPTTWERLRRIVDLGHRLGLHLDVLDTILTHGDLYEGVASIVERFTAEGFDLRYANCHGNSALQALGLRPDSVFRELGGDGSSTEGVAEQWRVHVGRYALSEMASRFGIEYWIDGNVRRAGELVSRPRYVSDNSGALKTAGLRSKPYEIDDAFATALAQDLRDRDALILLHPQFHDDLRPPPSPVDRPPRTRARPAVAAFTPVVYSAIEDLRRVDAPYWDLSVEVDGLRYDGRVNQRCPAQHLYVAFHGGVRGAKRLPVLARWTQHALLRAPIFSVFDPLIYEHPELAGGWYVGDAGRDAAAVIGRLVVQVAEQLAIPPQRVVCIGNSSGGFAAIRTAALIGGRYIAINTQTQIVRYFANGYEPFSHAFDPSRSAQENAAADPERWSAIAALALARGGGVDVRGTIIQNANDAHHLEQHAWPYCEAFGIPVAGGTSADGRLALELYEGPVGHGPEPAAIARRIATEIGPGLAGLSS